MRHTPFAFGVALFGVLALACGPALAQDKKPDDKPKPAAKPDEKKDVAKPATDKPKDGPAKPGDPAAMDPAAMEKLAAPGENHKLLENMAGEWTTVVKSWMAPGEPDVTTGTTTTKAIMGGRYFVAEHKGKMLMPGGPDGKKTEKSFEGMGISGYDNATQKFINTWMDNFGTGIMVSEGTYDAATKTFTYTGTCNMGPGMQSKMREVIKIIDKNKHTFEMYGSMPGMPEETKMLEITYTRKGSSA